jgi:hypothetical protein
MEIMPGAATLRERGGGAFLAHRPRVEGDNAHVARGGPVGDGAKGGKRGSAAVVTGLVGRGAGRAPRGSCSFRFREEKHGVSRSRTDTELTIVS